MLPVLTSRRAAWASAAASAACCGARGSRPSGDLEVLARGFASLDNAGSRQAFLHTVRAVIEPGGQRVNAGDRLALAALLPTLIVWGERDSIIPVEHGVAAHEAMPGSRLRGASRAPVTCRTTHDPERFAALLADFCDTTDAAQLTRRPLAAVAR